MYFTKEVTDKTCHQSSLTTIMWTCTLYSIPASLLLTSSTSFFGFIKKKRGERVGRDTRPQNTESSSIVMCLYGVPTVA